MHSSGKLLDIFVTALAGERCSSDDLDYVRSFGPACGPMEAVRANGILLVAGDADERQEAYGRLSDLLESHAVSGPELEFAFLAVALQARNNITFTAPVRQFVYRMCVSPVAQLRCNAIILLLHFGPSDPESVRLLHQMSSDPDTDVSHNARVALKLKSEPRRGLETNGT